jgi:hypothetical protein
MTQDEIERYRVEVEKKAKGEPGKRGNQFMPEL